MKLTEFYREELDREVERSRKALEQVPDGKYQWKPHERSMIFGYLADMVARLAGRHVWPLAASVLPSYETACLDMLAAGDLPLLFYSDGGALRWLVRSDEAGW